ncbi:chemotaxis protein [Fusobacterium sp.]|uniref:chemotaxis protein n=1 Tax=Fusobacterium sp. TaxID=68766 RepID=UPI002E75C3B3|nr:chemotaxis protein [Fusobacterium sp.]MEE1476976.1 chemotaxis protein [Fusobacterium sp.]
MEVYVDNVKIELRQKSFKSLGRAISVINKRLDKEDKIAHKIYINGHAIKDNSIVDVKNLKVIEVITKSQGGIILESIVDARGYIDKYFSMFETLGIDDQGILTEEEEVKLIEMLIFLRWFYNLLLIIQENHILDFIYSDFDEYIEDFKEQLSNVDKAYDSRDIVELLDIMEFDMGELLSEFYENIEEYYSDIAEEEKRKRLLN